MTLSEEQKAFLVTSWARYVPGPEIARAFFERFGDRIDLRKVHAYNPDGNSGKALLKWRKLHADTRAAFLDDVKAIPISHAGYRLNQLQDMFAIARAKSNFQQAAQLLEQAAREAGGAFTNKREVSGNLKVEDDRPPIDAAEQRALLVAALEDALRAGAGVQSAQAQPPTTH